MTVALASSKVPVVVAAALRTLLNGVWLGVLTDAELAALDESYYEQATMYRTAAWNERGLFDWEQRLVLDHFPPGARIIVTACGGGREVLALLKMGFDVFGYESHPALAAFAGDFMAEHGHPARIHRAPRDGFPPDAGSCDAIVVGWGAYSLIHDRVRRIEFLAGARRHLPSDGRLLLSYFERTADGRELRWTGAVANRLRRQRRAAPAELGDTLAPNLVHIFSRGDLTDELRAAGFEVLQYGATEVVDRAAGYGCAVARVR